VDTREGGGTARTTPKMLQVYVKGARSGSMHEQHGLLGGVLQVWRKGTPG